MLSLRELYTPSKTWSSRKMKTQPDELSRGRGMSRNILQTQDIFQRCWVVSQLNWLSSPVGPIYNCWRLLAPCREYVYLPQVYHTEDNHLAETRFAKNKPTRQKESSPCVSFTL